jgi:multidrug efflux pump subunit AcrA (membrane-fusion protein)
MNIRKILIIISGCILLVILVVVSSVSYNAGKNYGVSNAEIIRAANARSSETHEQQIKSVLVKEVNNSLVKHKISSSGRVVTSNNITISSEVQGKLIGNNKFKKGSEINKGEIIFRVENTDLFLLVNSKKSRFMSLISSNLADIKLDFKSEYDKWNAYFNSISLDNNLPLFPQTNSSKEKNYIISRSILAEYLSIKSDEEKLRKYTVLAPFDGIITKSYTDIGGNVNPGTPVVDFIRKGKMEIELTVNALEINFINIGDNVEFNENDQRFFGKIIRKGSFVNQNTQNISVFSTINADMSSIYNGMYLDAIINTKGTPNVFKLERRAVFDKNKVFVLDSKDKLRIKKVNIIATEANKVIVDNLPNNIKVVIEPLVNISKGTKVKAINK